MEDLGIVIVNYRTKEHLRNCLCSIAGSRGRISYRICVVDNASGDGSAAMVREEFPQVTLIELPRNEGYARANNVGLSRLGFHAGQDTEAEGGYPRYALLLNPDTLLPPDALEAMVAFMDERPSCGAAGPRLVREDGTLDKACRRSFPTPEVSFYRLTGLSSLFKRNPRFGRYNLTYIDDTITIEVDSVVGAFMMIRAETLREVGLLDERFFMYGEDLDLAFRIKAAGWQIWYNADVTVLHFKGESSKQRSSASIINFYNAMDIFHRKHYADTVPLPLNWLIRGAIRIMCGINLVRNTMRPPDRRGVASAV